MINRTPSFHPIPFTRPSFSSFRGSGSEIRGMGGTDIKLFANFDTHILNVQNHFTNHQKNTSPQAHSPPPRLPYRSYTILRWDFEEIVAASFQKMNFAGLVIFGHIFPLLVRKTATKYVRLVTTYACKNIICHLCWWSALQRGSPLCSAHALKVGVCWGFPTYVSAAACNQRSWSSPWLDTLYLYLTLRGRGRLSFRKQ